MSRIGNKIIPVPSGVKIQIKPDAVEVQGNVGVVADDPAIVAGSDVEEIALAEIEFAAIAHHAF